MPTYGYRCEKNGHEFEVVQSINDDPIKKCQVCGSAVRRIFYPVGIVFKGQGFYKTDNRGSSSIAAAKTDSKAESGSSSDAPASGSTPSADKATKAPASAAPARDSKPAKRAPAKTD